MASTKPSFSSDGTIENGRGRRQLETKYLSQEPEPSSAVLPSLSPSVQRVIDTSFEKVLIGQRFSGFRNKAPKCLVKVKMWR